jgi:hypothetical protein
MADKKISALTAASTPLAGTEVLPIVQSGATVQVSVANLTAGRAISATSVTASTGNFVVGTSGQGIDFSATPGTGTSELLDDYEEGTFTPVVTSQGGAITTYSAAGWYTKVGNCVSVEMYLYFANTGTASGYAQVTLPFSVTNVCAGVGVESSTVGFPVIGKNSGNNMRMWDSRLGLGNFFVGGNGTEVSFSATYLTT